MRVPSRSWTFTECTRSRTPASISPSRIPRFHTFKPLIGPKADQLYAAYLAEDKEGRLQLETFLESLLARKLAQTTEGKISLVPPEPAQASGPYTLGTITYGDKEIGPFGMREPEWIQHVGIFGRTGAGKTNLGYLVLQELQKQGKPFLVFDWKRNYRDLLAMPGFQDVQVYTIGREVSPLTFNPLVPPPGTPPKTWLKKIIEVIAHAYMLGNGVLYLLQQSVDAVYEAFGLYSGQVERYPTIRDVLDVARAQNVKGREAGWLSSTLRALSSLCFGDMDTLINEGRNQNLDDLLSKPVILELDALTQSDKVFFIQALLLWIHHRRMIQGEREQFRHAILIEEAHHILSNERRSLIGGQSIMEITFREIREYGESLVILDQHPSQISLPALGNTYTTICLNLKHSRDVSAMAQCMLLENDEKDLLGNLEVGEAVVKLQGRVTRPFQIRIPPFSVKKGTFSDEEVARRMGMVLPPIRPLQEMAVQPGNSASIRSPPPYGEVIALRFLTDIHKNPDSGVASRYKRLGISVRQGQKWKDRLVREGLIEDTRETTEVGAIRIIRLTEKGERIVKENAEAERE